MAQVKIYGLKSSLGKNKESLSRAIHESLMDVFGLPESKRFHRYILLDDNDFTYPPDRSDKYTIIELSIFEGRSVKAKKQLIYLMFSKIEAYTSIDEQDVEITIFETPMSNWGIRGMTGDELTLNYKVNP
ncbi:MAG: tautomerase family protein [Candidatus Thiodiazotropha sp. (ex Epidulcina cf. delphinae)]|nr:tautomerase family protein [Candidatus Thiodiazotropha sp. (ex Epidulcina cf. delphinae)]